MLCIPSDRSSRHRQKQPRMRDSSASSVAHPVTHRCPHGCIPQDPSCSGDSSDPLVDQVELRVVNPMYANVRYMDGRESTVSLRDLAPCPSVPMDATKYSQAVPSETVEANAPILTPDAHPDPEPC